MQYEKMRAMMSDDSKGELTEKQKKLPAPIQKAILQKMKKDGKLSEKKSDKDEE